MDAVRFLLDLNLISRNLVNAGYPNSSGIPNTKIRSRDDERYFSLIRRADQLVFDGGSELKQDQRMLQKIWSDCFKSPVQYAPKQTGDKPLEIERERVELLYLFSSVLSSVALTTKMNQNAILDFVGGMFQDEQYASPSKDAVCGLPYDIGSVQQRFFRKALRVNVSLYGRVETLTPMLTSVLPSQAYGSLNPVATIDSIFTSLPIGLSFEQASVQLAFHALDLSLRYSQTLKLMESRDEDYW